MSKVKGIKRASVYYFREGGQGRPPKSWCWNKEGVRDQVLGGKILRAEDSGGAKTHDVGAAWCVEGTERGPKWNRVCMGRMRGNEIWGAAVLSWWKAHENIKYIESTIICYISVSALFTKLSEFLSFIPSLVHLEFQSLWFSTQVDQWQAWVRDYRTSGAQPASSAQSVSNRMLSDYETFHFRGPHPPICSLTISEMPSSADTLITMVIGALCALASPTDVTGFFAGCELPNILLYPQINRFSQPRNLS